MKVALEEAWLAFQEGEVPIGATVVHQGHVVARARNRCEAIQDPTAHAEILAIRQAARQLGSYRLLGAEVYVTVEPCVMCAGALHLARVARVIFGCADPKGGGMGSQYRIHADGRLNHHLEVHQGVMEEECRQLLQSFFRWLRGPAYRSPHGHIGERWPSLAEGD